jgi:hypothetical protein
MAQQTLRQLELLLAPQMLRQLVVGEQPTKISQSQSQLVKQLPDGEQPNKVRQLVQVTQLADGEQPADGKSNVRELKNEK